jgi:hypothetical protein
MFWCLIYSYMFRHCRMPSLGSQPIGRSESYVNGHHLSMFISDSLIMAFYNAETCRSILSTKTLHERCICGLLFIFGERNFLCNFPTYKTLQPHKHTTPTIREAFIRLPGFLLDEKMASQYRLSSQEGNIYLPLHRQG